MAARGPVFILQLLAFLCLVGSASAQSCNTNYGETTPCCGWYGAEPTGTTRVYCPFDKPICKGYVPNGATGTCYAAGAFAEMGKARVGSSWITINLQRTYVDPVVITSVGAENWEEVTVRVQSVTSTSFQAKLDEPSNRNGWHPNEDVHYMVAERGMHRLADGTKIIAGVARIGRYGQVNAIAQSKNRDVRNTATCVAFGGMSQHSKVCAASGIHYCGGMCTGTAKCSTNSGLSGSACTGSTYFFPESFSANPVIAAGLMSRGIGGWMSIRASAVEKSKFVMFLRREEKNRVDFHPD